MSFPDISVQDKKEKFIENFARVGLSAKGFVYCIVSVLATVTAMGLSNRKGNQEQAFKMIYEQSFGQVLLVLIGIALLGYVTLRFFQAFKDTDNKGKDAKGIFRRIGYAISGLIHISFSFYAFKMAFAGSSGGGDSKELLTGKVLEYPGGALVIGIIAAIIIGQGAYQIYRGVSGKFMKKVELYHSNFKKGFRRVGVVGNTARGLVLIIVGYFFLRAAIDSNPKEAGGTEGAFDFLQDNFGSALVGVVAVGMFAYGLFMFVRAKHERIHISF